MSKRKKKILIAVVCMLAVITYSIRVCFLNINYGKTEVLTCKIGESISENAYQFKADEYSILTEKEFEEKYGNEIDDKLFERYSDVKILTVKMKITKMEANSKLKYKFDLSNLLAQLPTYSQGISFELFSLINTENSDLNDVGDKIEVILPYVFVKDIFSDKTWNSFDEISLKISFSGAEKTKKEIILQE